LRGIIDSTPDGSNAVNSSQLRLITKAT